MATEKRLIDANALVIEDLLVMDRDYIYPHENVDPVEAVADYLLDNDVIPVVRCKDCKWRHDSCFAGNGKTYCDRKHTYSQLDDFCSYGERKDND